MLQEASSPRFWPGSRCAAPSAGTTNVRAQVNRCLAKRNNCGHLLCPVELSADEHCTKRLFWAKHTRAAPLARHAAAHKALGLGFERLDPRIPLSPEIMGQHLAARRRSNFQAR
jgi:hypothetical protein